jgi:hypothetical protein
MLSIFPYSSNLQYCNLTWLSSCFSPLRFVAIIHHFFKIQCSRHQLFKANARSIVLIHRQQSTNLLYILPLTDQAEGVTNVIKITRLDLWRIPCNSKAEAELHLLLLTVCLAHLILPALWSRGLQTIERLWKEIVSGYGKLHESAEVLFKPWSDSNNWWWYMGSPSGATRESAWWPSDGLFAVLNNPAL